MNPNKKQIHDKNDNTINLLVFCLYIYIELLVDLVSRA